MPQRLRSGKDSPEIKNGGFTTWPVLLWGKRKSTPRGNVDDGPVLLAATSPKLPELRADRIEAPGPQQAAGACLPLLGSGL